MKNSISLWEAIFAIMECLPDYTPLSQILSHKFDWSDQDAILNNFMESENRKIEFEKITSKAAKLLRNSIVNSDVPLTEYDNDGNILRNNNNQLSTQKKACDLLGEIIKHANEHEIFIVKKLNDALIPIQVIANRYSFVTEKYANIASRFYFIDKNLLIENLDSNGINHSLVVAVTSSSPNEGYTLKNKDEIARYSKKSVSWVKQQMKNGLPHKKLQNRRVVACPKEIDKWLEGKMK